MKVLLFVTLLGPALALANEAVRPSMLAAGQTLNKLLIKANSAKTYNEDKDVPGELAALEQLFKSNSVHFKKRTSQWRLGHETLLGVIKQSRQAYVAKRFDISRQMIKGVPGLCYSCHSQDEKHAVLFQAQLPANANLLERAEFAMATRRPEEARVALLSFLADKSQPSDESLVLALRYKLQLAILTAQPADKLAQELKQDLATFKASHEASRLLRGWLQGLEDSKQVFAGQPKTVAQVEQLVKKIPQQSLMANPTDEIVLLKLRQDLHRLLDNKPSAADEPWILYWLGWSERGLSYSYFYSLADGYLRTCMDEWSKTKAAKKCFDEYQSFIEFAYTGSAGTDIPSDVKAELESYRKKVGR